MAFTSESALRQALAQALQATTDSMMSEVLSENRNKIEEIVYGSGGGAYPRSGSGGFKEAWKTGAGGSGIASTTFEYDSSKLSVGGTPFGGFPYGPVHQSVLDGSSQTGNMADFIYNGHGGLWPDGGRNAFAKLDKWFGKSKVKSLFYSGLEGAGLKVTAKGDAVKTET